MKYYFGLDALRASMMLLGLFVHAAALFNYTDFWVKSELAPNLFITNLGNFISIFRMETFFLLCGFLGAMLVQHKTQDYFLDNRKKRVLIPLISGVFLLSIALPLFIPSLYPLNISAEGLIRHFWFMITLLLLSLISITNAYKNIIKTLLKRGIIANIAFSTIIFTISSFLLFLLLKIVNPFSSDAYYILNIILNKTIYYLIFYIIGNLIYSGSNIFLFIKSKWFIALSLGLVALSVILFNYKIQNPNPPFLIQVVKSYIDFFSSLSLSLILFYYFLIITKINNTIKFLVKSSLIVYFFHYPITYILGPILDPYFSNVYFLYITTITLTFVMSLMVFIILKQFNLTRILFGIK
ncbi:hypothetical protein DWA21_00800 [Acinetobacter baumannii]|nr:hypothetical protein DWA21_00800 [Acinetobacter baumannii]